jgi:hypothetical protein
MRMGLGFSDFRFIAQITLSSVKLHFLLRDVDFCRAVHNVPVFQIYKIFYALKSVCILLKKISSLLHFWGYFLSVLLLVL